MICSAWSVSLAVKTDIEAEVDGTYHVNAVQHSSTATSVSKMSALRVDAFHAKPVKERKNEGRGSWVWRVRERFLNSATFVTMSRRVGRRRWKYGMLVTCKTYGSTMDVQPTLIGGAADEVEACD